MTMRGIYAPAVTPFQNDLAVHLDLLERHCRWLATQGAGAAIFGTNSEGTSLGFSERAEVVEELVARGLDPRKMMPGTGGCALPDVVMLTQRCVKAGVGGVLVLPPFFYKDADDQGLFEFFSELVERVGDDRLRLYLYHIPPISQIPISVELVAMLRRRYGQVIAGLKDSSGDWNNTASMLEHFAADGFEVFPASEGMLQRGLPLGAAGCISATANINPRAIAEFFARGHAEPDADQQQARLSEVREIFTRFPLIAAMKAALAQAGASRDWERLRPPLRALGVEQRQALFALMAEKRFAIDVGRG